MKKRADEVSNEEIHEVFEAWYLLKKKERSGDSDVLSTASWGLLFERDKKRVELLLTAYGINLDEVDFQEVEMVENEKSEKKFHGKSSKLFKIIALWLGVVVLGAWIDAQLSATFASAVMFCGTGLVFFLGYQSLVVDSKD
ncbi:hypothetical protein N9949_03290 [Akkermansiaceae bacterium]|nr:hypothetical protein [Akkermansiaceae bacterium]